MDGTNDNVIKYKTKIQEKNKNIKIKNDNTLDSAAEITDVKKLGSESLNSQVILYFYKLII